MYPIEVAGRRNLRLEGPRLMPRMREFVELFATVGRTGARRLVRGRKTVQGTRPRPRMREVVMLFTTVGRKGATLQGLPRRIAQGAHQASRRMETVERTAEEVLALVLIETEGLTPTEVRKQEGPLGRHTRRRA